MDFDRINNLIKEIQDLRKSKLLIYITLLKR